MSKLWTFCNYSLMSRIYEQIFKFGINMVKISVVIPIYNCEEYLEESIRSILNQTFKDIEIVCVDDGSTDNSLDILNKLASDDSRLKVFSQENQGSSFARNNALRKVSGDYVYFFDADDYLVEDALEKVYANAIINDSDIVFFKYDQYRDNKFFKHLGLDIEEQFPNVDFNDFTFDCYDYRIRAFRGPFAPWFKLYKRDFLDRYSFEFPVNLNHNDVPFHVKTFLKASKISLVPEYLYHYRLDNPNSISNTRLKNFKDIFSIIQIVDDFLRDEGLFEEFKKEFGYFKINRITYEISGRPNEYFLIAKEQLSEIDLENELLSKNVSFKAKTILNSNSIEEYNSKIEVHRLTNKNKRLSDNYNALKEQNESLKKDLSKTKKKNKEMLSSNSWKITKPLRSFSQLFRKIK